MEIKIENFVTPGTFFLIFLWLLGLPVEYMESSGQYFVIPLTFTSLYGIYRVILEMDDRDRRDKRI